MMTCELYSVPSPASTPTIVVRLRGFADADGCLEAIEEVARIAGAANTRHSLVVDAAGVFGIMARQGGREVVHAFETLLGPCIRDVSILTPGGRVLALLAPYVDDATRLRPTVTFVSAQETWEQWRPPQLHRIEEEV